jgi:hypothetical protein
MSGQGCFLCHGIAHQWPSSLPRENSAAPHLSFHCRSHVEAMLDVWRFSFHATCNRVRCSFSIWLSVLRQPAHQFAAPKCHTPSSSWPPVLRRPAHQSSGSREPEASGKLSGNHKQWEESVYFHKHECSTAFLFSSPSPSRPCLTSWSRGRRHCASLRQGQVGAPYRWR